MSSTDIEFRSSDPITVTGSESDDTDDEAISKDIDMADDDQTEDGCNPLADSGLKKKKTRGRVKIGIKLIDHKQKRSATFHKRKSGLMKKGFELGTLTGADVLVLAAWGDSVFSYSSKKLQRVFTSEVGQKLIHHCLNTPGEDDMVSQDAVVRHHPEGYAVSELPLPKNDKPRHFVMGEMDEYPAKRDVHSRVPMNIMPSGTMQHQPGPEKSAAADDQPMGAGSKSKYLTHSAAYPGPMMSPAQQQPQQQQQQLQPQQQQPPQPPSLHAIAHHQGRLDKVSGGGLPGLSPDQRPANLPVMVPPPHSYPHTVPTSSYPQTTYPPTNPGNSYGKPQMPRHLPPSYSTDYQANRLVYMRKLMQQQQQQQQLQHQQQQHQQQQQQQPPQPQQMATSGTRHMLSHLPTASRNDVASLNGLLVSGASSGGQPRGDNELFGMLPQMPL